MKERPTIFSGEMVRAILAGRKTQTRRVMKPQPQGYYAMHRFNQFVRWKAINCKIEAFSGFAKRFSPYGIPDDRLWVREAIRLDSEDVYYLADGQSIDLNTLASEQREWLMTYGTGKTNVTIPSIHMPRWASRITLEVTGVRVERVQDISIGDILAEGVNLPPEIFRIHNYKTAKAKYGSYSKPFIDLWDSINVG